jgi:hypothetical protein
LSNYSTHPVRYAIAPTGITPAGKGLRFAENVAGAAFKAAVVGEGHLLVFLCPGVTMCRADIDAPPFLTGNTLGIIKNNVRFTVDVVARIVKKFVNIDHRALQAVQTVEARSIMLTFPLLKMWLSTSMVMFCFGSPLIW